jgi:hypothetical protein
MHEAALELDGNRARVRWAAPGQVVLPVLTASGKESWPLLLAGGGRGLLTDEEALEASRAQPELVLGNFLHGLGTNRHFSAGSLSLDAAEALRHSLLAIKRRQPPLVETAMGYPAYLDETAATEAARAADLAGWRVQIAVPSALAWWAAARAMPDLAGNRATMRRRWWLVVEADNHGMSLTGIRVEGDHGVVGIRKTLRQLSGKTWFNRVQAGLADAVIRRCRRDPRALAESSNTLAARVGEMAAQEVPYRNPGWIELGGVGWNCRLKPTGDDIAAWCGSLVAQLAGEVESWKSRLDELGAPGGVVLAPGARLPAVDLWARAWCGQLGIPLAQPADHVGCDVLLAWLQSSRQGKVAAGLWQQASAPFTPAQVSLPEAARETEAEASANRRGYFEDISDLNLTGYTGKAGS